MSATPWILISIGILLIIFLAVAIIFKRKGKVPADYYSLFIMGIIWTAIGIPLKNYFLSAMGIVFLIIGLAHRDKWKSNRRKWKTLDSSEQKWFLALMILLGIMVLAGLIFLLLFS